MSKSEDRVKALADTARWMCTPYGKAQMLENPDIRELYLACKDAAVRESVLEILENMKRD